MSAKHMRPFYVFAAVAVVCAYVLASGVGDHVGGTDPQLPFSAPSDATSTAQGPEHPGSTERGDNGGRPGGNGGKGTTEEIDVAAVIEVSMLAARGVDVGEVRAGNGTLVNPPGSGGPVVTDDPDDDLTAVKGPHDDQPEPTDDPTPDADETDDPSQEPTDPPSSDGPTDPPSSPSGDPSEPSDPTVGGDGFSDMTESPPAPESGGPSDGG